jgi:predicted RNA-binding protein YlqC (UPF0109 family)
MDAPEALREFLMYVLAHLIEHPKQASIAVGTTTSGATSYRVRLAPDDVKRVVGKNGFTISAIRSLLNVAAHKYGVKISLRVDGVREEEEGGSVPAGSHAAHEGEGEQVTETETHSLEGKDPGK